MSIPVLNWSGRGLYYPQTSQRSVACWETLLTRLIIVSNRVGLPEDGTRAGGLEVAIRPALKRRGGIWFGWSGQISDDAPGPPKISRFRHKKRNPYVTHKPSISSGFSVSPAGSCALWPRLGKIYSSALKFTRQLGFSSSGGLVSSVGGWASALWALRSAVFSSFFRFFSSLRTRAALARSARSRP